MTPSARASSTRSRAVRVRRPPRPGRVRAPARTGRHRPSAVGCPRSRVPPRPPRRRVSRSRRRCPDRRRSRSRRSAETGSAVAATSSLACCKAASRPTCVPSGSPRVNACAAEEVPIARAPSAASTRAEPTSQALARTNGSPGTCRARKAGPGSCMRAAPARRDETSRARRRRVGPCSMPPVSHRGKASADPAVDAPSTDAVRRPRDGRAPASRERDPGSHVTAGDALPCPASRGTRAAPPRPRTVP